jgi:chemosensory pili system protein ChpA (sensor histidine kinase/response regulator)
MPVPADIENNRPQILVVDDDPHFLRITARVLAKLSPAPIVRTANDGFQTGAILESFAPELVILDLMMANMDGFRVCENIRKDKKFKKIKILMVTAFALEEHKEKAAALGIDKFIAKSGNIDEFKKTVMKLLNYSAQDK